MATRYPNGEVPLRELVQLDSGNGRHWSTPKGRAMWYALRRNVQRDYGVTLRITAGFNTLRDENAYRSRAGQVFARAAACAQGNCNGASVVGWSSHGGTWRSNLHTGGAWVDAMAFDIGNYWEIGKDAFYREARKVGFLVDAITPAQSGLKGGEPWHIILFDPYGAVPAGLDVEDFEPEKPEVIPEEDEMILITNKDRGTGVIVGGYFHQLNAEEAAAVGPLITKRLDTDSIRTWDLWRGICVNGLAAAPYPPTDIDEGQVARELAVALGQNPTGTVNLEPILRAISALPEQVRLTLKEAL